jgi:hypothetical protein
LRYAQAGLNIIIKKPKNQKKKKERKRQFDLIFSSHSFNARTIYMIMTNRAAAIKASIGNQQDKEHE